jgi:uncharacterized protein YukE
MSWGLWATPSLAAPVDTVTVTFTTNPIIADGAHSTTATATVTSSGAPVDGESVTFGSTDGGQTIGTVNPAGGGSGQYTAQITSSLVAGPSTITATDTTATPSPVSGQATLNQVAGPPANISTPNLVPTSILADGSAHSTATVTVTDANSNPVTNDSITFGASPSTGISVGGTTNHGNGNYSAQITGTTAGTPSITATDGSLTSNGATLTLTSPNSGPVNTALPTISGSTLQGSTLTGTTGSWTGVPAPSFTRQWQRCNSGGSACLDVLGATGTTYVLGAIDVGSTIREVVTASNGVGSPVPATSNATAAVTAPPVNTGLPVITGSPIQGQQLTASNGTWTGSPAPTFTRQWQRCNSGGTACANIGGATLTTYTPVTADLTSTLRVVVTANNGVGSAVSATSNATAVVTAPPANTVLPAITGSSVQGQLLTAGTGTWTGSPAPTFTYRWQDCDSAGAACVDIAGATTSTYTLAVTDLGATIRVVVTASNGVGSPVPATSAATAQVTGSPANTALPTVSGSTVLGQVLAVTNGTWTGFPAPTFSYQWQDCNSAGAACVNIAGATASSYTLTQADVGSKVVVVVTATNSGGSVAAATAGTALVTLTFYGSTTTLAISPTHSVTNQPVTLAATVGVTGNTASGSVVFEAAGVPISGCSAVPISSSTFAGIATCQAPFAALSSPVSITAVFTPAPATSVAGSTSGAASLIVGSDTTTTTLAVSSATVAAGQNVTFTATVTPGHAGPTEPLGTVDFLDDGNPIASCTVQPLTAGATSSTATCTTKYVLSAAHIITAHYRPTRNFAASTSAPQTVSVKAAAPPPFVATTMRWTFLHTPTYTQVLALIVNRAPTGGRLVITCAGRGCPYKKRVITVVKAKACKPKAGHRCNAQLARTFDLTAPFKKHRLMPGTQLVIQVLKKGYIGKYYRFTIAAKAAPKIQILCVQAGKKPGVGC